MSIVSITSFPLWIVKNHKHGLRRKGSPNHRKWKRRFSIVEGPQKDFTRKLLEVKPPNLIHLLPASRIPQHSGCIMRMKRYESK